MAILTFRQKYNMRIFIALSFFTMHFMLPGRAQVALHGSAKTFHTLEVLLQGSVNYCEQDRPDDDQLLRGNFTHSSGKVIRVYGHWAGDGRASASEGRCGPVWRINFTPTLPGTWTLMTEHHTGVAPKDLDFATGSDGELNGISTTLPVIANTDAVVPDFRRLGVVTNRKSVDGIPSRYPYCTGVGRSIVWLGAGSPEDLLGFKGFDGTYGGPRSPGGCPTTHNSFYHDHDAHFVPDPLAPLWTRDGQKYGRGLYGAINYLSTYGINNSCMLLNNDGGDGNNAYPYVACDSIGVFDLSKLEQWYHMMEYANSKGLHMELILAETENDDQIYGSGSLSDDGFYYLKRVVSQFGSLPAVSWVIAEECDLDPAVATEVLYIVNKLDAYDHLIGLHTRKRNRPPADGKGFGYWYDRLAGITAPADTNVSYAPMQVQGTLEPPDVTYESMWQDAEPYMDITDWVITVMESGTSSQGSLLPDGSTLFGNDSYRYRRQMLYAAMMRNFGGINVYFGSSYPGSTDISCSDFGDYDTAWATQRAAMQFFRRLPCLECLQYDEGSLSDYEASRVEQFWVMHSGAPELYVGYAFPGPYLTMEEGDLTLEILEAGTYRLYYFNPASGSIAESLGPFTLSPGPFDLPLPVGRRNKDWIAVLISATGALRPEESPGTRGTMQNRLNR